MPCRNVIRLSHIFSATTIIPVCLIVIQMLTQILPCGTPTYITNAHPNPESKKINVCREPHYEKWRCCELWAPSLCCLSRILPLICLQLRNIVNVAGLIVAGPKSQAPIICHERALFSPLQHDITTGCLSCVNYQFLSWKIFIR